MRLSVLTMVSTRVRVLNVAEKNDAAKCIAGLLSHGNMHRRESRSKYNKIYQFDLAVPGLGPSTMVFTSVSGHLMNYEFPPQFKSWATVPPNDLFTAPLQKVVPANYMPIADSLKEEAKKAAVLIVWTDCDREGENIGDEANPRIRVMRARFSEITTNASYIDYCIDVVSGTYLADAWSVTRAINELQDGLHQGQVDAVDCRQQLDLRTGAAFTRLLTQHMQRTFNQLIPQQQVVSYGSCQLPTLHFVVERYKLRDSFQPEPFWRLVMKHSKGDINCSFIWKRTRVFEELAAQCLLADCQNKMATVTRINQKPKSKWRPVALETVEFEKAASRKLRMNAKRAMTAAEKLYTQGLISYPRTETNMFPAGLDLHALVAAQQNSADWGAFATGLVHNGINARNGTSSDQAHPPIHPLKYKNPLDIQNADERVVYEFVVRHFLACVSSNAQGFETRIEVALDEAECFFATGLQITLKAYLDVYIYERWSDKTLPLYEQNERFVPDSVTLHQASTEPPALLTEADLITLMEKHGIGTDATHADHIEKIQERKYAAVRDDRRFLPGFLGLGLVDAFDATGQGLSKPELRAQTEAALKAICEGRMQMAQVLQEQIAQYQAAFQVLETDIRQSAAGNSKLDREMCKHFGVNANHNPAQAQAQHNANVPEVANVNRVKGAGVCAKCQSALVVRLMQQTGNYFLGCPRYPQCSGAVWLPKDVISTLESTNDQCVECNERCKVNIKFKRGHKPANMPRATHHGCLHCDPALKQWLAQPFAQRANGAGTADGARVQTQQGVAVAGVPMCACQQPAVQRTVRKEGANQGKHFFVCAKAIDHPQRCNHFSWLHPI